MFTSKCPPLLKSLVKDIKDFEDDYFKLLTSFTEQMVFRTEYTVEMEQKEKEIEA